MIDINETKELIKRNIRWVVDPHRPLGGQSCGVTPTKVKLVSEDLDLEITVGHCRSQIKNKEFAFTLFELALDDIIK